MRTPPNLEKKRILVVDDQPSNSQLVKLCLERTNHYIVRVENSAKTALAAAEVFRPHLILMDLLMPGMGGGELAACFQANPKLKNVPIVFLTAAVSKGEVKAVGGQGGAFPFLAKPFILAELVQCMKHYLPEKPQSALSHKSDRILRTDQV